MAANGLGLQRIDGGCGIAAIAVGWPAAVAVSAVAAARSFGSAAGSTDAVPD